MSTTNELKPLVSDEDINDPKLVIPLGAKMIRDIYEQDRANTQALLRRALEVLKWGDSYDRDEMANEIEKQLEQ